MNRIILTHLFLFFSCLPLCQRLYAVSFIEPSALYKELNNRIQLVTEKHETQKTKLYDQIERQLSSLLKEPIYQELLEALHKLHQLPAYKKYTVVLESLALLAQLQAFNHTITHSELLRKTNAQLDQLQQYPDLSSLVPLLKKQRVALIELLDEKDLIEMNEKQLATCQQELSALIKKYKQELLEKTEYKTAQQLQESYLQNNTTLKVLSLLEKIENLDAQSKIAIIKDNKCQKVIHQIHMTDPLFQPYQTETKALDIQKTYLLLPITAIFNQE